ncbi:MAG: ABC transporter permease, partial [Rhodobacteraceae bacterium]|nr:ABC transporter permease [Paracoccaceae bacterium]
MRDTDVYEDRIAALEAKIAAMESAAVAPEPARAFDWKDWGERYGLLVAWVLIILVLGAFKPAQMFAWNSYASMLGSNAMVVVLTLALIIPLTTGDFDLSVAATMGFSSMIIAVLNVQQGVPIGGAIIVALFAGAAIGAINAFFILYFRVFSLIVTLGTGYFVSGLILWISDSGTIA